MRLLSRFIFSLTSMVVFTAARAGGVPVRHDHWALLRSAAEPQSAIYPLVTSLRGAVDGAAVVKRGSPFDSKGRHLCVSDIGDPSKQWILASNAFQDRRIVSTIAVGDFSGVLDLTDCRHPMRRLSLESAVLPYGLSLGDSRAAVESRLNIREVRLGSLSRTRPLCNQISVEDIVADYDWAPSFQDRRKGLVWDFYICASIVPIRIGNWQGSRTDLVFLAMAENRLRFVSTQVIQVN